MINKKTLTAMLGIVICMAFSFLATAQNKSSFDRGSFIAKTDTLPYRILFPENFDPTQKYPLVIILHGSGERGNNNEAQLKYGTDIFLNPTLRQKFPAIVVFPQCPNDSFWSNVQFGTDSVTHKRKFLFQTVNTEPTKAMKLLMGLTQQLLDKPYTDKKKVYVGGLSMGGMGTFELIGRKTKWFAAAISICGGDNTLNAPKYAKKVPMWIFHGAKDDVVPADHSYAMVEALRQAGADPRFTIYPNDGHNSWDHAFAEPDLLPWLFSHSKK
jgi:predicted peptidase